MTENRQRRGDCRRSAREGYGRTTQWGNRLGICARDLYDVPMSQTSLLSRITVDPAVCHGKPCIRGLRYPVESILEYLAGGDSVEHVLAEFPDLERDDILACLEFSRKMLAAKSVHLALT
jgi:uncharacterized protein (DUF433 family)